MSRFNTKLLHREEQSVVSVHAPFHKALNMYDHHSRPRRNVYAASHNGHRDRRRQQRFLQWAENPFSNQDSHDLLYALSFSLPRKVSVQETVLLLITIQ